MVGGEDALVDDLRAGSERLLGAARSLRKPAVLVVLDLDDLAALRTECREECGFVLVPLARDELGVRVVVRRRRLDLAALKRGRKLRQVRAREMSREVGGRKPQRAVVSESHYHGVSAQGLPALTLLRSVVSRVELICL